MDDVVRLLKGEDCIYVDTRTQRELFDRLCAEGWTADLAAEESGDERPGARGEGDPPAAEPEAAARTRGGGRSRVRA